MNIHRNDRLSDYESSRICGLHFGTPLLSSSAGAMLRARRPTLPPTSADPSALAKAGKSVLHLDPNEYYGGEQASLTLDELVAWADARGAESSSSWSETPYGSSQRAQYSRLSTTGLGSLAADRRRYALSLFPALMVSRGELVSTLISSDVAKYVGFRLLDGVSVWNSDTASVSRVPGSKEDVFRDKSISLPEKRKLMKALMFAGTEFEEDELLKGELSHPL